MCRVDILCGISKDTFEIPHKISYLYIERKDFSTMLENVRALRFTSLYAFLKRLPCLIIQVALYILRNFAGSIQLVLCQHYKVRCLASCRHVVMIKCRFQICKRTKLWSFDILCWAILSFFCYISWCSLFHIYLICECADLWRVNSNLDYMTFIEPVAHCNSTNIAYILGLYTLSRNYWWVWWV